MVVASAMHHAEEQTAQHHGKNDANGDYKGRLSNASRFLSSMTPKSLSKFTADRLLQTTSPMSTSTPNMDLLVTQHGPARTPSPERKQRCSSDSQGSQRSNSTTSNDSGVSEVSNGSKRSSWTRSLLGMRSKSSSSLQKLEAESLLVDGDTPAVPNCLQGHEIYLRRILQSTQKNVQMLIVRTQHTETDVLQMVARHCNHVGCRRKLINAAMRNLEKRIVMLNKFRDTIIRFVISKHQEFLQALPPKKAEADALFELCQRSGKECMRLANQGASQSGTLLVSIYDRLHAMQNDLNNAPVEYQAMADAPSRSLSALSIHSHGEGDLEDYVMTVVPTIPQSIPLKLTRPAKHSYIRSMKSLHAPHCTNGNASDVSAGASPCCSPGGSPRVSKTTS